ncbi:MAG TPA: metal ABC transporter permease [Gaiellaceae bacterium]|nr:metal ABC transporter permease [Gaiellaceae bacterium]
MSPHFSFDPLTDVHQLLVYPFMVNAIEAGTIVAVMASVVGWFMVLRRETFAGHTLSLMSFPGASGAALAGLPLSLGYFSFCVVGSLVIAASSRTAGKRNLAQESAVVGTVQAAGLALGFLFLSLYGGILENLEALLFGSFLGITTGQVEVLAAITVGVLIFIAVAGRPLLFTSIDELAASARGVPVRLLQIAFLVVLGLAVAATAQITGVLLVFALLVAPAAAAQQLTARIPLSLALTVVFALVIIWVGLTLAYFTVYSVGFYVATIAFALYVVCRASRLVIS